MNTYIIDITLPASSVHWYGEEEQGYIGSSIISFAKRSIVRNYTTQDHQEVSISYHYHCNLFNINSSVDIYFADPFNFFMKEFGLYGILARGLYIFIQSWNLLIKTLYEYRKRCVVSYILWHCVLLAKTFLFYKLHVFCFAGKCNNIKTIHSNGFVIFHNIGTDMISCSKTEAVVVDSETFCILSRFINACRAR